MFKFLLEYTRNATDATQISEWEQVVALVSGLVQAVIAVMSWMSVCLPTSPIPALDTAR